MVLRLHNACHPAALHAQGGAGQPRICMVKALQLALPLLLVVTSISIQHAEEPLRLLTGLPHTSGHPTTRLPAEVERTLPPPSLTIIHPMHEEDGKAHEGGYIACPIGGGSCPVAGHVAEHTAQPTAEKTALTGTLHAAAEAAQRATAPGADSAQVFAPPPPSGPTLGDVIKGPFRRLRRGRMQRGDVGNDQQQQGGGGAETGSVADPLSHCTLEPLLAPVLQAERQSLDHVDTELAANAAMRKQARQLADASQAETQRLEEDMLRLDDVAAKAAERMDFSAAVKARQQHDSLAVALLESQSTARRHLDALDGLAALDTQLRHKQAAALEGFAARLSDLTARAAAALEVLTAQLQATHSRTDAAASARGSVMEALAYASNANAVRNELRDLEDACLGQLQAAQAALADTQRNSRAALAAAGELALNLTRSEAVAGAARAQAALLQLHMELAVQMQEYGHAARLQHTLSLLGSAGEEGAASVAAWQSAMAHSKMQLYQCVADHSHHSLRSLQLAGMLAAARRLRHSVDLSMVDDSAAMAEASRMQASLQVLASHTTPPRAFAPEEQRQHTTFPTPSQLPVHEQHAGHLGHA